MLIALLFFAALALAFANGGLLRSRRVAETMTHKITIVGNAQGLLANSIATVSRAGRRGSALRYPRLSAGAFCRTDS